MPKLTVDLDDLDALERNLRRLGSESGIVAKVSLYDGAKIAADALRKNVDNLERVPDIEAIHAARRREPTLISVSQKNGLRNGLGISKMKTEANSVYTTISFHGYNTVTSPKWPGGQPNALIAASCEKGSSRMQRQRFIEPALSANRSAILRAMIRTATETITKILEK